MEPAELRVIQLARQIGVAGLRAAKTYNEAQACLDLHQVLTPQRLASPEGTAESLRTLARLSELTSAHREMFEHFVTTALRHYTAAVAELPADRAAEYRDRLAASINQDLQVQSDAYADREEWIASAARICNLVEDHRAGITFTEGGLVFSDDHALEEFELLVAAADQVHRREVARASERIARIAESMAILNGQRA